MRRKGFFFFFFFFFLFTSFCLAQLNPEEKLEILLKEYEEASDLSHKTRVESLGHYIIFTRKDLELMQAHNLLDVVKSIPFHTIAKVPCGSLIPVIGGALPFIRPYYVIYIDDYEVSTSYTPFLFHLYTEYPLDNIDHIEFYMSYGSGRLGNEPGFIVIKLYHKEPKRENISYLRQTFSNTKGYDIDWVGSKSSGNFETLISANYSYINNKDKEVNFKTVKNDSKRRYLFVHFKYKNHHLDFQIAQIKGDAFMEASRDASPDTAEKEIKDFFISYSTYFLKDKSIKFNFNFNYSNYEINCADFQSGLKFPPINNIFPVSFEESFEFWKYTLYLSKKFNLSPKNQLLTVFTYKHLNLNNTKFDIFYSNLGSIDSRFPKLNWKIYSFLIDDQYNITSNNLLFASIRYDIYDRNHARDENNYILRAGYVSIFHKNWHFKTFLSRFYSPLNFMQIEKAVNPEALKSETHYGISGELSYRDTNKEIRIVGSYFKSENVILKTDKGFINYSDTIYSKMFMFNYKQDLSEHINIELNFWRNYIEDFNYSSRYGGFFRILGDYGKYDFFMELIYKAPFKFEWNNLEKKIDDSWDLNLGLSIKLSSKITLQVKGENLLNDSPKGIDIIPNEIISYNSYDRKFFVTLEFMF